MPTTIKGFYEQGHIILREEPPVTERTEVIITFLTGEDKNAGSIKRIPGGLKGRVSIPDDFDEPIDDLKDYM